MTCDELGDQCICAREEEETGVTETITIAFTGHRPPKAGLTYSHTAETDISVVEEIRDNLRTMQIIESGAKIQAVVGGALGFDTLAARACWLEGIPYIVAVPFTGQESIWPAPARARYARMLEHADQVVVVSQGGYSPAKMHRRNHYMVDRADHVWAFWDGSQGGTSECIAYAVEQDKFLYNLYESVMKRRAR